MKIFATTDTHFGHDLLTRVGKVHRPFDFKNKILGNLLRVSGDLLIHCGDFCIGDDEDNHKDFMLATVRFKKKVLVRGNHDSKSNQWYYDHGWDFVCNEFKLKFNGRTILFSHMPFFPSGRGELDYNVHGHLHGAGKDGHHPLEGVSYDPGFHKDVAPDTNDYWPVNLNRIIV